jgi:putative DNA methylase
MTTRKKLIEVALPLEAINKASAREKSIRHGHPSTLHLWWARRPLAAARAVIFAQMVDDPSSYVDELKDVPNLRRKAESVLRSRHKRWEEATALAEKAKAAGIAAPEPGPEPKLDDILAEAARNDLFKIIEDLVLWENTTNETVLQKARDAIWDSWRRTCRDNAGLPRAKELFDRHTLPAFHDPFAGGGALPLEAQRLGLEAYASDLNPVAVLICKAMIEIPPKFAGRPPVNPESRKNSLGTKTWKAAQGLAEDVRYYGQWMRDEAEKRIGHLYPKIEITATMAKERPDLKPLVGRKLTVIAWLWARTVKSPNPAFRNVPVPLASTFMLSTKPGKEAWVEPVIEDGSYRFTVKVGKPKKAEAAKAGTAAGKRAAFRCLMSGVPVTYDYIRTEGKAGRIGARLMAIVAEGEHGRVYLAPTSEHEEAASAATPKSKPEIEICHWPGRTNVVEYGLRKFGDLFTSRQLTVLSLLTDLIGEAMDCVRLDAQKTEQSQDAKPMHHGGIGSTGYAEAVGVYLSFAVSRLTMRCSSQASWDNAYQKIQNAFGRQSFPMVWDYCEGNPFGSSSGNFRSTNDAIVEVISSFQEFAYPGFARQADAMAQALSQDRIVSTDPPYYDNIPYADLSDFFYAWLRLALRPVFPDLFGTMAVPKAEELVATPSRHGGKLKAEQFFLQGMTRAMHRLAEQVHPAFPVSIYYAFKQSETQGTEGTVSTGWETFLNAVICAGFGISGTWPLRTEMKGRVLERSGINVLASSILLVCQLRPGNAPTATRREFVAALQRELPKALRHLQAGNIAPVDLAQAAIGPGMAVFTRYAQVLDAQGKALTVREALALINETLDTALAEQEGDFDADTRFALTWFEQNGFEEGEFGVATVLARAKNTGMDGLVEAGIIKAGRGKVRLLKPDELDGDWDPATDKRLTNWEMAHQLIRALVNGETDAAGLVAKLGAKAETARELAYRLYTVCERKKRAPEALAYNSLVQSWPELIRLAQQRPTEMQAELI